MGVVESLREPVARDIVETLGRYGEALRADRQFATAIAAVKRGLNLDPQNAGLWASLGCSLWNESRFEEALGPMERALALAPDEPCHSGNLALLHHSFRDYEKAEFYWARTVELAHLRSKSRSSKTRKQAKKDMLGALWDRSLMRLENGDWERGLRDYETRIERQGTDLYPKMPIPMWAGESLDGKTLYVQAEQGLGDRILFSRYLKVIKDRWPTCRIKGCFNEQLADLFWDYRHATEMLPHGIPWPDDLDYGIHQASLPYVLGTRPDTIPPDPGYILSRVRTQHALGSLNLPQPRLPSLKIGFAWTGNPAQTKNHLRTVPLEKMLTLAEDPGITLYSFQVGPGSERLEALNTGELIVDLGGRGLGQHGLVAAGVAMMEMDAIVTVCTATAHLAGALGLPTLLMLSWDAYWIWMRNPDTTPWYPSVKIFRQARPGDWDDVLKRVKAELRTMMIADDSTIKTEIA